MRRSPHASEIRLSRRLLLPRQRGGLSGRLAVCAAVGLFLCAATGAQPAVADTGERPTTSPVRDGASAPWPFARPPLEELRRSPRKVFAHYFVPFPLSFDNRAPDEDYYARQYLRPEGEAGKFREVGGFLRERPLPRAPLSGADWVIEDHREEVRRAVALGLDGFTLDLLASSGPNWDRAIDLMHAASQVDPGFRIVPMPDMNAEFRKHPENLLPALRRVLRQPSVYRLADGRSVVSPYNAQNRPAAWWRDLASTLAREGLPVAWMPVFQGWQRYLADYAPVSLGVSDWGVRSPGAQRGGDAAARRSHDAGVLWMAPVSPQDFRPKDRLYWEAGNSANYRTMWENAIRGDADWVQVITWNDYSEATEISPSSGTQWAFYDLTAYYVAWFKTGHAPAVTRDALFYFHRSGPLVPELRKQDTPWRLAAGSDRPSDEIEVLAFLTQPGDVRIALDGDGRVCHAKPPLASCRFHLAPGTPTFSLVRAGHPVITLQSAFHIDMSADYQDPLYRAGSSTRAPTAGVP